MAYLTFDNIKITGMSACVPKTINRISDNKSIFTEDELAQFTKQVGIVERRFADANTCASDLCEYAAEKLIESMSIDKTTIDLLVMVTQSGDYPLPASSIIIQDRLKLQKTTAAFDVNLGCSGYVYGLSIVYSFMQQQHFRKALLLVGDTSSKAVNPKDKATCLLFGDSGTATIIEKDNESNKSYFSLNSDGSGYEAIIIRGGGCRQRCTEDTLKEMQYEDGSVRSAIDLTMSGPDVFNFTIREVPKSILELLAFANVTFDDTDYLVYHQANRFINDFLTKKLKYPKEKVPYSLTKYGNTSCASIPMTIVTELRGELSSKKKLILSGFGVGLSWANAIIDIENCHIPDLMEI